MKILVVESNLSMNNKITQKINQIFPNYLRVLVYACTTGKEAIRLSRSSIIDVFLISVNLKDISGIDLGNIIRKSDIYALSWIVYLDKDYSKMKSALHTHFIDYFAYPLDNIRFEKKLKLLESFSPEKKKLLPIVFKYKSEIYNYEQNNIYYIEIIDKLLYIVAKAGRQCVGRHTLEKMMLYLDENIFIKVNRATLINIKQIRCIEKTNGAFMILFKEIEDRIYISRQSRDKYFSNF